MLTAPPARATTVRPATVPFQSVREAITAVGLPLLLAGIAPAAAATAATATTAAPAAPAAAAGDES